MLNNMKNQYVPTTLGEFINESKTITLKRGYGDKQPVVVGSAAPLRNQVLSFVAESKRVSRNELRQFIAGLNENNSPAATTMWLKRNAQYFIAESKNGVTYYKLSTVGQRLANRFEKREDTSVSEGFRERMRAKKKEAEECEECEEGDEKADFYDKKKGYPRPGLNDMTESEEEVKEDRVERVLESLRKKRRLLEAEEAEEEEEVEETPDEGEEKAEGDDEFNLDDLDMGTEGEEGEEVPEEGGDEKVEITEFILTVDNPDEAIKELEELGITAQKVEPEAEDAEAEDQEKEGEGNDLDLDLEEEPAEEAPPAEAEPEEAPVEEAAEGGEEDLDLDLDLEAEPEGGEGEEAPAEDDSAVDMDMDKEVGDEAEGQIKVSADNWEALKGWLEAKGVDVAEMFGGEIEVEDGEEEGETEEPEGEGEEEEAEEEAEGEEATDLNVDVEEE